MNDFAKLARVFASALLGGVVLLFAKYMEIDPSAVPAALGLDQPLADASTVAVLAGMINVGLGRLSKVPGFTWVKYLLLFPVEPVYPKETNV